MMARTQIVTARVDSSVKSEAEKVFVQLGLTTPQAIKLFLTQVKLNRGIPFDLTLPNRTTRRAIRDADAKRNSKSFKTAKALFKDLGI
jgi:DNA-damage-inducible protein J